MRHFSAAAVTSDVEQNKFSIKGLAIEGRPAYLDFQATTPMDPRVLDEMVSTNIIFCWVSSNFLPLVTVYDW